MPHRWNWIEEAWEEMSKWTLHDGFDWMNCILSKGSRFNKFMMLFVDVLPKEWLMQNDVSDIEIEVKTQRISK